MVNIKIYLAGPSELQLEMKEHRYQLEQKGATIVSTWIDLENLNSEDPIELAGNALNDLLEIRACDIFILFNPAEWANRGTGGRHVEFGFAMLLMKKLIIVGDKSNVYHHFDRISVEHTIDDVIAKLEADQANE